MVFESVPQKLFLGKKLKLIRPVSRQRRVVVLVSRPSSVLRSQRMWVISLNRFILSVPMKRSRPRTRRQKVVLSRRVVVLLILSSTVIIFAVFVLLLMKFVLKRVRRRRKPRLDSPFVSLRLKISSATSVPLLRVVVKLSILLKKRARTRGLRLVGRRKLRLMPRSGFDQISTFNFPL